MTSKRLNHGLNDNQEIERQYSDWMEDLESGTFTINDRGKISSKIKSPPRSCRCLIQFNIKYIPGQVSTSLRKTKMGGSN